jgi:hypothetical protein
MQVSSTVIERSQILVNPDDILRLLGEQEGSAEAHATALVDQYIEECTRLMTPVGGYVLAEAVDPESSDEIAIEGLRFQTGKIIHKMMKHSETYAFFLVTAGPEPERLARDLLEKGEFLEGYISDLVASALADAVADCVHEEISKLADSRGLKVSNRYSPGYCSWDVAEQQKLFSLFPDNSCGISLTDSSLMIPVKSVSGLIGLGRHIKFNEYTCEICPMKNCLFSKAKNQ